MSEYSLEELKKLAGPALRHSELVRLAAGHRPKRTHLMAVSTWPRRQASAARFLAILRRDYGQQAFEAFISSVERARPQGTEYAHEGAGMTTATVSNESGLPSLPSHQFPFDGVCHKIAQELKARNWRSPGVTVETDRYGLDKIKGQDYLLRFGPRHGKVAVSQLVIPKRELTVYACESGPTYYVYVGNNWPRDREQFMNESKHHAKLEGQPRTYLRYFGQCFCPDTHQPGVSFDACDLIFKSAMDMVDERFQGAPHTHKGRRSPFLVHDNDLGREYDPEPGRWSWRKWRREPGDPTYYDTNEVFLEFARYLEEVVLAQIVAR